MGTQSKKLSPRVPGTKEGKGKNPNGGDQPPTQQKRELGKKSYIAELSHCNAGQKGKTHRAEGELPRTVLLKKGKIGQAWSTARPFAVASLKPTVKPGPAS